MAVTCHGFLLCNEIEITQYSEFALSI